MKLANQSKLFKSIVYSSIFSITLASIIVIFLFQKGSKVEPEWLGNPLREDGHTARALNVWDLQVFEDRIYLGGGSTVTNSGPIKVWAYNPQARRFIHEHTVKEEAIEHFRVFNRQLYIPAADPTKGDRHKFYRREAGQWQRYDSARPKLAHVRDLIETDTGEILMVGNSRQLEKPTARGTAIALARQNGLKIKPAGVENAPEEKGVVLADYNWFFSVFRYQNRIFATNSLLRDARNFQGAIAEYDPQLKSFRLNFKLRNDEFIPADLIASEDMQGIEVIYRPWNPVQFQEYLVYPVRSYSNLPNNYEEAYMNTSGFFYKSGMGSTPQPLKLPKGEGEDVLVIDNKLYVLANRRNRNEKFTTYVYKADLLQDKTKWKRVLKFTGWNKARSFEYLNGTFYFGLGHDYGEAVNNSGDILGYSLKLNKEKSAK